MPVALDKTKAVLILLDNNNDIVHSDGKFAGWGFPQEVARRGVLPATQRLLAGARQATLPVIHVKVAFRPGLAGIPQNAPLWQGAAQAGALVEGDWGAEIHDDVQPRGDELVIVKRRVSAFYHTDLQLALAQLNVTTLILCGVATNYVVEGTARDAADAGYQVIIAEDCCSTLSEEAHQASLQTLGLLATITNSSEIAAALA